jgi:hypothetical protein
LFATLYLAAPDGFILSTALGSAEWHDDLPWFLHDQRPSGFLGKKLVENTIKKHRTDGLHALPGDIRLWGSDDVLRYLSGHYGEDIGSFIVGQEAYDGFIRSIPFFQRTQSEQSVTSAARDYEVHAADVLASGHVGSSAAGEQPKFLVVGPGRPRLVKFSPPYNTPLGRRRADLIVAEHLCLESLRAQGREAAESRIVEGSSRRFLEVIRFDRRPGGGRIGQVSLEAVEAQFVGRGPRTWSAVTGALVGLGMLSEADHREARWLEAFGQLVGNTDMHLGNLSLRLQGAKITGLTPAYDVLPMIWSDVHGELPQRTFAPRLPEDPDPELVRTALVAALDFWERLVADPRIGEDLRGLAKGALAWVRGLQASTPTS